ncbi:hypothetical protein BGT96224_2451 [Blumeria graminis f. sp. tritici 96224]|uniref:Uncharacterized protein n=1 Tax=Blumeria graminis f. sp. tritici 96224 TaxID=1268274 RepID=A0A656KE74_BLUGR|nr:hypothetical protein BGT96224_2451 [Blumeria graminis f. sp. tritici 96224]
MPQQYSFPPPPPGSASPNQHGNQYLYGQHPTHYQQHQLRGGGSHRGGRGGDTKWPRRVSWSTCLRVSSE